MLTQVLRIAVEESLALFGVSAVLSLLSLKQDPMLWGGRGPADVRNFIGSMTRGTRQRQWSWWLVQLVLVLLALGHVVLRVVELDQNAYPATGVAAASLVTFLGFGVHEVAVNGLLALLRPPWAFVPGIMDLPGFRDRRWHWATLKRGLVPALPVALVVTILGSVATGVWGVGRVLPDTAVHAPPSQE